MRNECTPPVGGPYRAARRLTEMILDDLRKVARRATSLTLTWPTASQESISTDLLFADCFLVCVQALVALRLTDEHDRA